MKNKHILLRKITLKSGKASTYREISDINRQRTLLLECYESVGLRFILESIAHTSRKAFGPQGILEFCNTTFRARLNVLIRNETKGWLINKAEQILETETGWTIDHLRDLGIIAGWFTDKKDETGIMKAVAQKMWDRLLINTEFAVDIVSGVTKNGGLFRINSRHTGRVIRIVGCRGERRSTIDGSTRIKAHLTC